jgi:hypothetical protein
MSRYAIACLLAACGDNVVPAPLCNAVDSVFVHQVPLRTLARTLPNGEILLAGTFSGTVSLGDATLTSAGGTDIFVARVAADGRITASRYGDDVDQDLQLAATNASGDIALAGRFLGTLDVGSNPPLIETGSTSSMYLVRFAPGGLAFARSFAVEAILRALALSPSGDVAIAGSNFDPIDFGGGTLPTGGQFLGVVDAIGAHVASRLLAIEDISVNLDVGVAFDRDELLVAGSYTDTIDLGGGALQSAGALDHYLARFARDGTYRTSRRLGGPGNDGYHSFDGDRISIAPVDGGTLLASSTQSPSEEIDDAFVTLLDPDFTPIWTQALAYPSYQAISALAIADDGTIAITGISSGATDPALPGACGSESQSVAFATTFDPDGRPRWNACFPADTFSTGLSVAWRQSGELVITGRFDGNLEIGDEHLASEELTGFVVVLRPRCD